MAATGEGFEAIVLAAGTGSRFGGGKLLAPWSGGRLIEAALAAAFAAPVRSVRVVVGDQAAQVSAAVSALAQALGQEARLHVVEAVDCAEGMGASLRAGVADLPPDAEGVVVFLADMPRIPGGLAAQLIEAVCRGAPAAAPFCEGKRGHPVAFSAALLDDLAKASGDAGAREVLKALGDRLALIPTDDPGVHYDVDRPEDL